VKRCRLQVCVSPHREPSDVSHIFGWILPVNYWPLLGIAVIVIGFLLRFNPVPVVLCAALSSNP